MKELSLTRRLADGLVRHAGRMLPACRREKQEWAEAMRQETDSISDDRQALGWALGCVFASYAERIEAMNFVDTALVRGVLVFFIVLEAWSNFFATIATVSYRSGHLGVIRAMSGMMPGDDYRPFIPLMNTIPWWDHALWVSAALFYFAAAALLFTRRRAMAFPLFTAGFGLAIAGEIGSWIVMSEAGLHPVTRSAPTLIGKIIQDIPEIYLPLGIIFALWLIRRRRTAPGAPA